MTYSNISALTFPEAPGARVSPPAAMCSALLRGREGFHHRLHFASWCGVIPDWHRHPRSVRLRLAPARYCSRLLDPARHLRLVEIVLVNVDPTRFLARASRWNRSQRRAFEKGHLDVAGEDVQRQEPALALDAIEG